MVGYSTLHMLGVGLIAWLISGLMRFDRKIMVVVILTATLPNAGNFGLSVNQFAFGETALAFASLYFVTSNIIANTGGVFIASLGKSSIKQALFGLRKIPGIYAVLLAIIFLRMNWSLPVPLERTTSVLANGAIPSMLVLLGLQLQRASWSGQKTALGVASAIRLVFSIGIAIWFAKSLGLVGKAYQAGVLEAAMPTAVMTTVLTTEFDVNPSFATQVVLVTTILSPLTLTPLLLFLGG